MPTNAARNNGRVTNLHLSDKLDWVIESQKETLAVLKGLEVRVREGEVERAALKEQVKFRTWAHGVAEAVATGLGLGALLGGSS